MADTDKLVIGLTGSFGSGCTTLGQALESNHGFKLLSLSAVVKHEWEQRSEKTEGQSKPTRQQLQDLGNDLRSSEGQDTLAKKAAELADAEEAARPLAFDSIKNLGEVNFFRQSFRNFFLVAVQCSSQKRWSRVEKRYREQGLGPDEIQKDDIREQVEADLPHGQQVQLCVDEADIVISNEDQCHSRAEAVRTIQWRAEPYLGLITKDKPRPPSLDEVMMSMAYIQSTRSGCIKRQVGAVIVDDEENIVSAAFNENPPPLEPCRLRSLCEKESKMIGRIEALEGSVCPGCHEPLGHMASPYRCPKCGASLKELLYPDRGVQLCPAIHAEDAAIRQAPRKDLRDCTLYTTTFPCINCAKAITYAGIKRVVYVEPYPDGDGAALLEEAGKGVLLFEGVKARAFHRLFAPIQAEMEKRYGMGI